MEAPLFLALPFLNMQKAVDLFCGCGGFSAGLAAAGAERVVGADWDAAALAVYASNFGGAGAVRADLSREEEAVALLLSAGAGGADVVVGSPPCQDFSSSGKREEGARASLTVSFARIVSALRPPAFVMENVPQVASSAAAAEGAALLREEGYHMRWLRLNAADAGVAQSRVRAFLVGFLSRAGAEAAARAAAAEVRCAAARPTVWEALGGRCGETVFVSTRNEFAAGVISTRRPYPTLRSASLGGPGRGYVPRSDDAGPVGEAHRLSGADLLLLSGFPPSFRAAECSRTALARMAGNCVPPPMAAEVLRWVKRGLAEAAGEGGAAVARGAAGTGPFPLRRQQRGGGGGGGERAGRIAAFFAAADAAGGGSRCGGAEVGREEGGARRLSYRVGASAAGDAGAEALLAGRRAGRLPEGTTLVVRERRVQTNNRDDLLLFVPGVRAPFRSLAQLRRWEAKAAAAAGASARSLGAARR